MHTEGPLLLLAGAGSGKTKTMTHRIAHLIDLGVSPWNILAVTFTNKAAREMRMRVEALVGETAKDMWITTFHSMCLRFLYMHPEKAGYKPDFVIYDTSDQKTLVKNITKDLAINDGEFKPQDLRAIISGCKEKEMDPDDFKDSNLDTLRNRVIYDVYSEYEKRLKQNNAMDFDDLLLNGLKLLKSDRAVREKYQDRFRYIMVDEYQDTNQIQYKLVSILAEEHRNLCVVGDDDQCIYQWRGADIRNILDFEKDFPDAKVIKLEQNYRSVGNILAAAHSVIKHNKGRKPKELWTKKEDGEKIRYSRCGSDKEEAGFVAGTINGLNMRGRPYSDFAILYRTNAQSRLFEEALTREGIPYQVLSGVRYYDRKEIKDLMAYMSLVVNPMDDLALMRVINEPKRGVGSKTVAKLKVFADVRGQSLFEALADPDGSMIDSLGGKSRDKVKEMIDVIKICREQRDILSVQEIFDLLMDKTGYLSALEESNRVEDESRIENLMEFKTVIAEFEKDHQDETTLIDEAGNKIAPIDAFMTQLPLTAEIDGYDDEGESVVMMTLHSAKGLEFPVVFMPGMEDGLFPGSRAFDSIDKMEEERRLCYVGMTRARELLYLSSAEYRMLYGRSDYTRESQFLREIDKKLLTGDRVYEGTGKKNSLGIDTGSYDGYSGKPFKPFDSLKYAKMETKKNAAGGDASFEPGDRVSHPKFGSGLVIGVLNGVVTVAFDDDTIKKLAAGIAPLKKIKE